MTRWQLLGPDAKLRKRSSDRAALARRRERLKNKGICVDCGSGPAMPGQTLCGDCLGDRRDREFARIVRSAEQYQPQNNPQDASKVLSLF